ncbi:hypothetical protein NBRC10512_001170 [Rhodotorula toruloides]|uniref:RHTO0S11e01046g1_1 n=2 Tax=Rhodotorula toruloides TaxID=5286 RepID=A0A061BC82_RHOTO|nr:uncharacterized protein RHTO_03803 [Rhodotorula toruloides NP11]EMS20005.1 hypothetical protein RHTO_03803 [Rhodotorula toruloides NP11]CDR45504.1 RHTO0S11e01046g1_1 [Rhodotorula toruloides]
MRTKKASSVAWSPAAPANDDPFFVRPGTSDNNKMSTPYSATAFDRYMGLPTEGSVRTQTRPSSGGLGKKLLSFPWSRSEKKQAVAQRQAIAHPPPRASTPQPRSPRPDTSRTTNSLPLGFPAPPSSSSLASLQQHPSASAMTSRHVPGHPTSNSSLSTVNTASSFASTSLFTSADDGGWQSDATTMSLGSTPESVRAWRMKGLASDAFPTLPDIVERDNEDLRSSICEGMLSSGRETPVRRNSTPIPAAVAAMLAPETPPRPKRHPFSSATTSPTSPKRARELTEREGRRESPASANGDEADDEVSPPRQRRSSHPFSIHDSPTRPAGRLARSMRIPSIRFEGISMDAVFAEVEAKISKELAAGTSTLQPEGNMAKRRSRMMSLCDPVMEEAVREREMQVEVPEETTPVAAEPETPASSSMSSLASTESTSSTNTEGLPLDIPRPRPWPRRTSSRPAPLDVGAANALVSWSPMSAPLLPAAPMYSPTASHWDQPVERPASSLASPFSPSDSQDSLSPRTCASPMPMDSLEPQPSPALSTTSTFRPCDIPELFVCPPSPPQNGNEEQPRPRPSVSTRAATLPAAHSTPAPRQRANSYCEPSRQARPVTMIAGPTKVTVLPPKRMVRMSTRAPSKRAERPRTFASAPSRPTSFSPPSTPTVEVTPPAPGPPPTALAPRPPSYADISTTPPVSPTCPVPPSLVAVPYHPPTTLRTDFHPALSTLAVEQTADEDSSDCEESLHNMLMRLNRPLTPPPPSMTVSAPASPSLTSTALEMHNTSQKRMSMLAREMGDVALDKENLPLRRQSSVSRHDSRRYSKLYKPEDVIPLALDSPKPLSPAVIHPLLPVDSDHGHGGMRSWSSEEGHEQDVPTSPDEDDEDVDIEGEIDRTLASLAGADEDDGSHSTYSSGSTASEHLSRHGHTDSQSSIDSAIVVEAQIKQIPRSDSQKSDLTDLSFDSTELEEGVVCLGERISCNYNVGVIGMAI